jgi:hypothetical protein
MNSSRAPNAGTVTVTSAMALNTLVGRFFLNVRPFYEALAPRLASPKRR